MTLARRLSAATMALLLVLFPLAMERCRTACVTGVALPAQPAPSAHACHDAEAGDDGGPQMHPMARACGHNDEGRTYESAPLAADKARSATLFTVVKPLSPHAQPAAGSWQTDGSTDRLRLSRPPLALNSPLRL
jgi:hypothetical protein